MSGRRCVISRRAGTENDCPLWIQSNRWARRERAGRIGTKSPAVTMPARRKVRNLVRHKAPSHIHACSCDAVGCDRSPAPLIPPKFSRRYLRLDSLVDSPDLRRRIGARPTPTGQLTAPGRSNTAESSFLLWHRLGAGSGRSARHTCDARLISSQPEANSH